jgi:transketolase
LKKNRIAALDDEFSIETNQAKKISDSLQKDNTRTENEWKNRIKASQAKHIQAIEELQKYSPQRSKATTNQND